MDVSLAVVLGLLVAGSANAMLEAKGLGGPKGAAGALFLGALAGLAAGDLLVEGAGAWWEARPMLSAALGGLLLLGLAVLVIDEVIARTTAGRWRRAARDPVARLAATRTAMTLERLCETVAADDWKDAPGSPPLVRSSVDLLNRTATSARALTPLLAGSDDLLDVYAAVSAVADQAERLARYGSEYVRAHSAHHDAPTVDTELALFDAALRVEGGCQHVNAALDSLDGVARRVLGAGAGEAASPDAPFAPLPRDA